MTSTPQAALNVTGLPALVAVLHHGDVIHLAPHKVFQHDPPAIPVTCREVDVEVDCLLPMGTVTVICWLIRLNGCTCAHGATVYDADDSVERLVVVA